MRLDQLFQGVLLTGTVVVFISTPAICEEVREDGISKSRAATVGKFTLDKKVAVTDQEFALAKSSVLPPSNKNPRFKEGKILNSLWRAKLDKASKNISQLSEIELPATSARMLVQAPTPTNPTNAPPVEGGNQGGIVPITGVKANPTDKGVEVILQTTQGQQLQVTNRSAGNNFVADISGGQLRLPSGEAFTFRSSKPLAGITEITVTNVDANTVRVTVVGEASQPTVELFDDDAGLVFGVAVTPSAAQPITPQKPESEKPTSEKEPEQPSADSQEPIELVVTGEQDGYRVPDATTATRTDTPLRDIPQSIQVVPRQVIEDQQVLRINDALRNASGIQASTTSRDTFDQFLIRGFRSGNEGTLRNGLRDRTNTRIGSDPANLERLEVLKGPSSVLYGQGALGGTINLVTKQPLREPFYSVEAIIGNFDFYRGAIDLSGPLNSNRTLLYRLNAAAETSEGFVDFYDTQRYFASPVLTWLIGKNTKLNFEAEYLDTKTTGDFGLPAIGTVLNNPNGNIPRNRFIGEPSESKNNRRAFRVGYNFEHRFSENWQVQNAFRATFLDSNQTTFGPTALLDDGRTLERIYYNQVRDALLPDTRSYFLDTYTVGKFKTGSIQHQLVIGFDLFREQNLPIEGVLGSIGAINLFNPVYGQPFGDITSRFKSETTSDALGIYVQDQITLFDNLKLLLGGRFDIVSQKFEDFIAETSSFQQDEAFSPRIGIVYQPIQPISLYASYSQAFNQVTGSDIDNQLFRPERGTQYEVGIKADLSDRVSATLAFYNLTRSNVLVTNPDDSLRSIQTGEQRSRGIEFDISGQVLPGWNIIANYAYTDARITENNNVFVGNQLIGVPEHSFGLWTTYEMQTGLFQGLGFGLGLFYVGERQGDLANTFELPSYLRTDAAIFYKRNNFRAAVNIKNLFDIGYFEATDGNLNVYPGAPLTVQGTISWNF